jgi:5-methylcytosine-specific restriction endonuclease McrA
LSIQWMDGRKVKKDRRSLLLKMGYSIYDKVRIRIADDRQWRCEYCDCPVFKVPDDSRDLATIDHRIPLSRGGVWKRYNLTCACRGCNEEKGSMTDDEYRFYRYLIGWYGHERKQC